MKLSSQVLIGALFAVPNVSAYGSLGHVTIATIASRLVSPSTEAYFKSLLGNENDTYLSSVATWADSYKYTKAGHFSSGFHYIDAKDSPPKYCGVDFDRDCKSSGCVVTALQNYTSRLLDPSLPPWDRVMAAKFVVHFVGDIHQPLHAENVARGGNGIHVKWHGTSWNLHHVWDSSIAEEMNGGYHRNPYPQALKWGCVLADEILEGKFAGSTKRWLQGMDLEAPIDTAMLWANESNSYVCSVVMPEGPEAIAGQELAGQYFETAAPVVESLITRAGYRLAMWLDLITDAIEPGYQTEVDGDMMGDGGSDAIKVDSAQVLQDL